MTIDEMIEVLQAAKEGKTIQLRCKSPKHDSWSESSHTNWNFFGYDYRVKPEPRVRFAYEDENGELHFNYERSARYPRNHVKLVKFVEVLE